MLNDGVSLSPVSQQKLQTLGTEDAVREEFQKRFHTLPASISKYISVYKMKNYCVATEKKKQNFIRVRIETIS